MMEYSIVIPVFNSQDTLGELYNRINETLKKLTDDFEIIFIDDYSSDGSWNVLTQIKNENPSQVKIISFAKNYGQHNATMCGFRHAKSELVITLDDDLQHNPEDIPILVAALKSKNVDILFAIPKNYKHKKGFRKYSSRIWKFLTHKLNGGLEDGSSFRVIRKEIIEKVVLHRQEFIFIDEMLGWYTDIIGVKSVDFNWNGNSKSGYSGVKLIFLMFNLGIFYSTIPLKMMTYGGILMSLFSFVLGLRFVYKKIFIGVTLQGYTSLMVAVLFSTSLLLICLGIVGQYLGKIYTVLNNKPTYSIKEKRL